MRDKPTQELLLDDHRGIYIPQAFYDYFDFAAWGLHKSAYPELASPNNEWYWEAWDEVLREATMKETTSDGWIVEWYLYQDGDLWAIPANATHKTTGEYIEFGDDSDET